MILIMHQIMHAVPAAATHISVEVGIVFSARCSTLESPSNITMLSNMALASMAYNAGIPISYISATGVNNSCAVQRSRQRSLFQITSKSPSQGLASKGSAILKFVITWPIDVVNFIGLTTTQAFLIVANCTSSQVMSSIFTPDFMAAFGIISVTPLYTSSGEEQNLIQQTQSNDISVAGRHQAIYVSIK